GRGGGAGGRRRVVCRAPPGAGAGRRVSGQRGRDHPAQRGPRRRVLRGWHDREVAVLAPARGARDGGPRLASHTRQPRAPADPRAFLVDLVRTVGDTGIAIRPDGPNWPATESPIETELFRAIMAAAHARHPGVLVTTPPLAGFTDSHFFRNLGIVCYGVSPFPVSEADSRGVHGNNERLSLDALAFGVHFMYDVIASVAAK